MSTAPAPASAPAPPATGPDRAAVPEVIMADHETADRILNLLATVIPMAALGVGARLAWGGALHWQDLVVLFVTYVLTGLGITVGFHRLFTHRSFQTSRPLRAIFAVLGSMAVEGPLVEWVSVHRKHHRFSDQHGDPHSPHVDRAPGASGALRGLFYAHLGWLFRGDGLANPARYAKDLLADRDLRFINATFPLWVLAGLALPFGLGVALTGTLAGGLTGLLWGGAVRIFLVHHATFSINSLCHFFGRRTYDTGDESRNLVWLAPLTFGESWHNNHHAFPTAAHHGHGWRQLDPSAWVITGLERCRLASQVVRVTPERRLAKKPYGGGEVVTNSTQ